MYIQLHQAVKIWLFIGLVMLFFQIFIGGVTRLTGSGLSITKWEIVTGTFPPMSIDEWHHEFELYKSTPQYQKINEGMELSKFKFIYFWEYFHRLWARIMGLVFILPFIFFSFKGWIPKLLYKKLAIVVFLAAVAASFGWIMVASGLIDRPWVNAYKLSFHLCIGVSVFMYMLWIVFESFFAEKRNSMENMSIKNWLISLNIIVFLQIFFGGLMSGMKAGLFYPTWPDLNSEYFPQVVFNINNWTVENFQNYDQALFAPALVQFVHRGLAYLLILLAILLYFRFYRHSNKLFVNKAFSLFCILLVSQVVLGIITLINCIGTIPVNLGIAHQSLGLLFFGSTLLLYFLGSGESNKKIQ